LQHPNGLRHSRKVTGRIKAISFDADGTLLGTFADSPRGFEKFFLEAARSHGKKITLEIIEPVLSRIKEETRKRRQQGFKPYASEENSRLHWLWFYEEVFKALDLPNPKTLAHQMITRYESGEFTTLYSDTLPCLKTLASKNIPMIVISNYAPLLERFLNELGIDNFFQKTLISGIVGIEKPDPAIFQMGAKALSLNPQEILHIGNDLHEDYHGATQSGFQALLLDRDKIHADKNLSRISSLHRLKL